MNIEFIKKMLAQTRATLDALVKRNEETTDVEELRAMTEQITEARSNIAEYESIIANYEAEEARRAEAEKAAAEAEARAKNPIPAIANTRPVQEANMDYRSAFKALIQHGTPIPAELITDNMRSSLRAISEARGAGTTLANEISALIPETTMSEVIREAKTGVYGQLFDRVRKLNIRGGVRFPLSNLEATFSWINDGDVPEGQKAGTAKEYITFGSNLGVVQINTSILASIEADAVFYSELTKLIAEAFYHAIDMAIMNGTGNGQPLGITKDPRVENEVRISTEEVTNWQAWEKIITAVPLAKRGGTIILPIGTVDKYLRVLHDDNNRPLFYDLALTLGKVEANGIEGRFDGQDVLAVENDIIKDFDTAASGDVIGVYANLGDYAINSNLQFAVGQFRDQMTLQDVTRGMIICDGKLLDKHGVVLIKKA